MTHGLSQQAQELFPELRAIWSQRNDVEPYQDPCGQIVERACELTGANRLRGLSQVLLYGRLDSERLSEELVGRLLGIVPGVVIFCPMLQLQDLRLMGLLERYDLEDVQTLFGLSGFAEDYYTHLYLDSLPKARSGTLFAGCPVLVDWQIGAGMAEECGRCGIDRRRWEVLGSWLDRWLPAT